MIPLYENRQRRLKVLVQRLYLGNKRKFSFAIKKSSSYTHALFEGAESRHHKNIGEKVARQIENALGLKSGWLDIEDPEDFSGLNELKLPTLSKAVGPSDTLEGYVMVIRRRIEVLAGTTTITFSDEHAPPLSFRAECLKNMRLNVENLGIVYAKGDSMLPRIHDGDMLLVDTSAQSLSDAKIYVLRIGDDLHVKKIFRRTNSVIIHSDNPAYPHESLTLTEAEHLSIIGRVVWLSGML
jgi:phage repressor protein C with HTH and peptisase S24 domain